MTETIDRPLTGDEAGLFLARVAAAGAMHSPRVDVERAFGLLSKRQIEWLSRWACDGESQEEIAAADGMNQCTISRAIASALRLLAAHGVPVEKLDPATNATQDVARAVLVSPDALDRLVMGEAMAGSIRGGRWIDAD